MQLSPRDNNYPCLVTSTFVLFPLMQACCQLAETSASFSEFTIVEHKILKVCLLAHWKN